jgi:hypothetical protein
MLGHLYPHLPADSLCRIFKRTRPSINQAARKLGLRKTPEYFAQYTSRFQPGHKTWNTGLKGWQAGGRSAETQYKPGREPSEARNYRPIGSIRLSKEGYLERKWTDDQSLNPTSRWRGCHVELWEQHHGKVPEGHAVCFINGDKTDLRIDNLECITRSELMARNTVHRLPKELAEICQLYGALNRQINQREKSA